MADEPPFVEPLGRGYKRLPSVDRQIADALDLDPESLVRLAQGQGEGAVGSMLTEALVYFIRRAIRDRDEKTRDELIRELLQRCNPHFRGKFRGFNQEDRKDLQSEVQTKIIEDLFARDDRGDFMQVRFWKYLERKCIDACRTILRQTSQTESLETGYSGNDVSEGLTKLDQEVDGQLSPEEFAMISEGLEVLPPHLRQVFVLRHRVGMNIGSDNPSWVRGKELTIAAGLGLTGRTIRNWLNEAERLLAEFREKHDGR